MCNGLILGEKIDSLIKELGLTQTDLAKQLNISQSTIASWKSRNSLPPIETLCMIADFFQVSLEWLVTEDSVSGISDYQMVLLSRKDIRNRIYDIISSKTNNPDADNEVIHKSFFTNIPVLTYRLLYNWSEGRINLNEYVLTDIAYELGVTIDYLLFGINNNTENQCATTEQILLEKAKRNLNCLNALDSLTGHRKQIATDMLFQFEELEKCKNVLTGFASV